MPKAVAILEGDSDSLVKSIKKAKDEMLSMEAGGKTLSRQLKDVANEADKAAGNLVGKIGGGAAVKAIAGVGAAYKAARMFVDELRASSSALFEQNGKEGQAVFSELSKTLDKSNSAFARAVLMTDDMYVASGRMYAAWTLFNDLVDSTVDSFRFVVDIMSKIPGTFAYNLKNSAFAKSFEEVAREGEARAREAAAASDKIAESFKKVREPAAVVLTTVEGLETAYASLAGRTDVLQQKQRTQAIANIDNLMKQIEATALLQNQADNLSGDNIGGLTDEQLDKMDRLKKLRDDIVQEKPAKVETVTNKVGGKGGDPEREALLKRLDAEEAAIKASRQQRLEDEEQLLLLYGGRAIGLTREQALSEARIRESAAIRKRDAEIARNTEALAAEKARIEATAQAEAEFDAKKAERDALNAEREKQKVADIEAGMKAYGSAAAQQLVTGKKAAKVAEDLARQAIGGQISALGDEAMAKAAIYAAALNPLAVPMAAAGVAAYAAAAALGSSAKKASSGTPAAAAPVQAAPVNTSFNLRVDAAFADGESIARQFAMMQQAAQRRGLVPVGA